MTMPWRAHSVLSVRAVFSSAAAVAVSAGASNTIFPRAAGMNAAFTTARAAAKHPSAAARSPASPPPAPSNDARPSQTIASTEPSCAAAAASASSSSGNAGANSGVVAPSERSPAPAASSVTAMTLPSSSPGRRRSMASISGAAGYRVDSRWPPSPPSRCPWPAGATAPASASIRCGRPTCSRRRPCCSARAARPGCCAASACTSRDRAGCRCRSRASWSSIRRPARSSWTPACTRRWPRIPRRTWARSQSCSTRSTCSPTTPLRRRSAPAASNPDAIGLVVMTHLHYDHASGATQFPGATFLVERREWDAASNGGFRQGYHRPHLDPSLRWRVIDVEPEADLFGDGSVRLLHTPGHTPGHLSLLLRLAGGERLLLTADAAYAQRTLDERLLSLLPRRRRCLPCLARPADRAERRGRPRGLRSRP